MKTRLIKEEEFIKLDDKQLSLVRNGWGDKVVDSISVSKIIYHSDGYLIDGYIAKPKLIEKKLPMILWNRGGDESDGRLDDFLASGILGEIASWGYIVIASQYRKEDEFGGKEINDVMNLLKAGMELIEFDGENIGVEGWSRGGMMTYILLTQVKFLKCAISVSGISNLKRNFEFNLKLRNKFFNKFNKYSPDIIGREIELRSAVNFYDKMAKTTPLLLIHGTGDDKVLCDDSKDLYHLLKPSFESDIELVLFDRGDHYLRSKRKEVSILRKSWFDKYLKFIY
ncbi:MAG: prolyl oligopeptidase family serine peptidase [Ignavibacteria bacterium]|nr:prolyl oligopeptidase family serine peptidase [Ignavibacteria bacterium]